MTTKVQRKNRYKKTIIEPNGTVTQEYSPRNQLSDANGNTGQISGQQRTGVQPIRAQDSSGLNQQFIGGGNSPSLKRRVSIQKPGSTADSGGIPTRSIIPLSMAEMTNCKRLPCSSNVADYKNEGTRSADQMSLKFRNQTPGGTSRFSSPYRDGTPNSLQTPRSNADLYSNIEVENALSSVRDQQKKREQERVESQLNLIKRRIERVLEGVGMSLEDSDDGDDDLFSKDRNRFPMYDSRSERDKNVSKKLSAAEASERVYMRERMMERDYIIGTLEQYEEKALLRKQFLTEVNFWLDDNINMCHDCITPEQMKDQIHNSQELHLIISRSLEAFMKNADKVVDKGKLLLQETSKIIAERTAQMSKKTKKERITVYDDTTLLQEPAKWETAGKTIISVFEDTQKMMRNVMFKNALRLGQRQFEYMITATDKRNKELDDKKKHCSDLQGKLHSSRIEGDKMRKEIGEQRKKSQKLLKELTETKQSLEQLSDVKQTLINEIADRDNKVKDLEAEKREILRTPTPPPTPPEPEIVFVKVVDSATDLRLKEVEEQLEVAKEKQKKLQDELQIVTEKVISESKLVKSLQRKVTELENMPPPEPILEVTDEVNDKDAAYYKTIIAGMKHDYEEGLETVKSHMLKEKVRGEAGQRKLEFQHKDQLNIIQKDILRMMRAIMHFRDHMITCLEKENLLDQAQALQELGNIVKDKISQDPKELLLVIVSTVIEYLHNMEGILYNSFKAMKIMMRYQIDIEVEAKLAKFKQERETKKVQKEVQKKTTVLKGARKDVKGLAKRLKKVKNKLNSYQKGLEKVPTDKRYLNLLQRYNQVIGLYKNMCTEMEILQSDFHDTMQKKLEEKETMVVTQMKMEIKQQRAITEEQLKISIMDKRQNLHLLSKAYEDNKISKDLYKMASAMIKKAMEIPCVKLKNLFEQYITFRTVQEAKVRVSEVLHDEGSDLLIGTRHEMENYVDQMDEKFDTSMTHWRVKMKQLDIEKRDLNKKIYNLFNEVLLETGILLVHPLLKDSNKRNIMTQATGSVTRQKMQQLLFKQRNQFKTFMDMPSFIQGCSVNIQPLSRRPLLKSSPAYFPPAEPILPSIVSPHLLSYNINSPTIQATRQLRNKSEFKDRKRNALSLKRTEGFNINDINIIHCLHEYPDAKYQQTKNRVSIN